MTTLFSQSTNPGAIFKLIDTDGGGTIDMAEMTSKLAEFGLTEPVAEKVMKVLDTNGDGVVDETEFKAGYDTFKLTLETEAGGASGGGGQVRLSPVGHPLCYRPCRTPPDPFCPVHRRRSTSRT